MEGAGTRTYWHQHKDRTVSVQTVQDLAPHKDHVQRLRADPDYYGRQFKAEGTMHAFHVPAVMQLKLYRKYGIQVWNKHHYKDMVRVLTNDPDFEGCIVNRKAVKRMDQAAGMVQRRGIWQPQS